MGGQANVIPASRYLEGPDRQRPIPMVRTDRAGPQPSAEVSTAMRVATYQKRSRVDGAGEILELTGHHNTMVTSSMPCLGSDAVAREVGTEGQDRRPGLVRGRRRHLKDLTDSVN